MNRPRASVANESRAPTGAVWRVNDQLRYLKAFELLLLSISPRLHGACRWAYDRVGPQLAAWLVRPLLADLAYACLKPAEWLARGCLSLILTQSADRVRRLYPGWRDGPAFSSTGSDAAKSPPTM